MHARHHRAAGRLQAQAAGDPLIDRLGVHAQGAAAHLAGGVELAHHAAGQVGGDGEAQADVAGHAALDVEAGGVDAHQLAAQVDQRAARVAGVDGGIGLDEVLVAHAGHVAAAHRRDDARGHGLAEAERIAKRHHEVADLERAAVGQRHRREVLGGDAHERDVGFRVGADELGVQGAAIVEGDRHRRRFGALGDLDHVVVGEHQPPGRVHDHARAERFGDPLLRQFGEHAAEERIVAKGAARAHALAGMHAHHRRDHPLEHWRQRRQRLAVHGRRQPGDGHVARGGGEGRRQHLRLRRRPGLGRRLQTVMQGGRGHAAERGGGDQGEEGGNRSHGHGLFILQAWSQIRETEAIAARKRGFHSPPNGPLSTLREWGRTLLTYVPGGRSVEPRWPLHLGVSGTSEAQAMGVRLTAPEDRGGRIRNMPSVTESTINKP